MPRETSRQAHSENPLRRIAAVSQLFRSSRQEADTIRIGHASSFTTQIILRCHFPNQGRPEHLVLGNTSQANADGCQVVGRRFPVASRG